MPKRPDPPPAHSRAAKPRPIPPAGYAARDERAVAPAGAELVGTAIQALGELAQIGLTLGGQTLRSLLGRLPRP